MPVHIERGHFGAMPDGRPVDRFTLRSPNGISATVLSLGGILQSLRAPDRDGIAENVTLGCRSVADYLEQDAYLGAIIGRNANRLARGRFTLDDTEYQVSVNEPPNSLHGGTEGFDRALWRPMPFEETGGAGLLLTHSSEDGDQGYPGTLDVSVRYFVTDDELRIDYLASTDRPTIVNLTSHAYWNLGGEGSGSIENHDLWINARHFTPIDAELIPTGAIDEVAGTPFDFFSEPKPIGRQLGADDPQMLHGRGYDHNFVLEQTGAQPHPAARVVDHGSGRVLEVQTMEAGLQFYSGNMLDGSSTGLNGKPHARHGGFCLETQAFPDAPNQPQFPTTALRPGRQFRSTTSYRFTTTS